MYINGGVIKMPFLYVFMYGTNGSLLNATIQITPRDERLTNICTTSYLLLTTMITYKIYKAYIYLRCFLPRGTPGILALGQNVKTGELYLAPGIHTKLIGSKHSQQKEKITSNADRKQVSFRLNMLVLIKQCDLTNLCTCSSIITHECKLSGTQFENGPNGKALHKI